MLQLDRAVFSWLEDVSCRCSCVSSELLTVFEDVLSMSNRSALANDDVVTVNDGPWIDDSVKVQLVVGSDSSSLSLREVDALELLILLLRV